MGIRRNTLFRTPAAMYSGPLLSVLRATPCVLRGLLWLIKVFLYCVTHTTPYRLAAHAIWRVVPSDDVVTLWSADAVLWISLWRYWVTHARPHPLPLPITESTRDYVIDLVKGALREPGCKLGLYILMGFTITVLFWAAAYQLSRFLNYFSPIHYTAWVDRWFPPETITHRVQSANGEIDTNANNFREIFTMKSFMLDRAHLALENTHKYAARRRLAAVNMI